MTNSRIRFIARTAILLSLTIVFQFLGRFLTPYLASYSNFVVGPLVNACLLVAAATVGIGGAAVVALLAPFGAILTGAAIPLPFAPFIAVGNFLVALGFYLLREKNRVGGLFLGAFLKTGFLWGAILFMVPVLTAGKPAAQAAKMASGLVWTFSWPQMVTALLGGMLALAVIQPLKKNIRMGNE